MGNGSFDIWAKKHAVLFGFGEQHELMVRSWRDLFVAHGYALDELDAATKALGSKPPEHPSEHLAAIHQAIRTARAVAYKQEAQEQDLGACTICGNSGRVVVPHVRGIRDGLWVPIATTRAGAGYYTMAVACHCAIGRRLLSRIGYDHSGTPRAMLTLDEYTLRNPDWQRQLQSDARRRAAVQEIEALMPSEKATKKRLDEWWQALKDGLAERFHWKEIRE